MKTKRTGIEADELDLKALMQKWQKILRLQDWELDIQFVEPMLIG